MDITTIDLLEQETAVLKKTYGISVKISNDWIVPDEDRLSYTTFIRLVECCREYHWRKDVLSILQQIDSINVHVTADFFRPIYIGKMLEIQYIITKIGNKSYTIRFNAYVEKELCAVVEMVSVFYDANKRVAIPIPEIVRTQLI